MQILPLTFATLCAAALLAALYALFRSLRAAFTGEATEIRPEALVTDRRVTLLAEKTALLASLRDLESDHEAGKTSDEDRDHSNARLRTRAKAVLRALEDEIAPHRAAALALLELPDEIAVKTEDAPPANPEKWKKPAPAVKEEPRAETPVTKEEPVANKTTACAACSTVNDDDAAFCKKCGARLAAEVTP